MSRIRIVKGTITKITRGDHYICSETSINNNAATSVVQTSEEGIVFGNYKEIIFPPDKSLIRCAVHFRPHKDWKGEGFGFDWMRLGDGEGSDLEKVKRGDIPYRYYLTAALGVSSTERDVLYAKLKDTYESPRKYFQWFVKDLKGDKIIENGKPLLDEYCPSWLMLFPEQIEGKDSGYENTEATLSMIVDNRAEGIESYKLEYDKELFEISHDTIPTTKGLHKNLEFKVKCLKSFTEVQEIKVIAQLKGEAVNTKNLLPKNIVGKLKVLDNAFIYQPKIVLVKVTSNFEDGETLKIGKPKTPPESEIRKYLKQALMVPEIVWDELDITLDKEEQYFAPGSSTPNRIKRKDKFLEYKKMVREEARINHEPQGLQTDFLQAFMHDTGIKYRDHFKVFYIDEATIWDSFPEETLKRAVKAISTPVNVPDGRYCIIFRGGLKDKDTIVHEILHAMGLKHTFDDGNLFVFRKNDTDNIMDYDDVAVGGEQRSPDKLQLWKWQIDYLRDNAKNNNFIYRP